MIVSVSRRTDIPCLYADWFLSRLRAGFVLVPNPRNSRSLTQLCLNPQTVDCLVFWTKNPQPLMGSLKEIDDLGFKYYFEFTLTPYGRDFEPGTRDKKEIVSVFRKLADQIGPRKVDWRYDPIIFTPQWTVESHLEHFYNLASSLAKSTSRVIVSFVDTYRHVQGFNGGTDKEIIPLAQGLSKIGAEFGLKIFTCAEKMDITAYGIEPGSCVDQKKIEEIIGSKILAVKDHGQRETCGCIESFDIGIYNTCSQGCAYCYATTNPKLAKSRDLVTNDAPMMVGLPPGEITIHPKKGKTQKIGQSLFSEP